MNEFPFTEADLKAAAIAVSDSMLASLPEPDEIEHEFSEGFLKKMDALLALDKRRQRARSIARRAAMIALAVLVSLGAWLSVDTEARAIFVQWIKEVSRNYTIYRFFGNQPDEKLPQYAFGWLPDGFTLTETETDKTRHYAFYKNESTEQFIVFSYSSMYEATSAEVSYDYEGNDLKETVSINGITADYYPKDATSDMEHLTWIDESRGLAFHIDSNIGKQETLKVAASVAMELPTLTLSWMPDGFVLISTETNKTGHIEIYENKSTGYEVFFMYRLAQSGFVPMIVYDYGNETLQETVHVHDVTADYYPADENSSENTLVWIDEKQGIWFELSSGLSKETILRMAESVS